MLLETINKTRYSPEGYDVGGRIREKREAAGLTQEQLAERAGISGNAISRCETAENEMRISTLFKIADGLGISPDELMPERFAENDETAEDFETDEITEIVLLLGRMEGEDRGAALRLLRKMFK
mgnify:CR=1 FL=1